MDTTVSRRAKALCENKQDVSLGLDKNLTVTFNLFCAGSVPVHEYIEIRPYRFSRMAATILDGET